MCDITENRFKIESSDRRLLYLNMDDISQLKAIQQELKAINEKLGKLFSVDHPKFEDVFEDVGAAEYYIRECNHFLNAAIETLRNNGKTDEE